MIPLAALPLLRRFWPVLVGVAALAAVWLWHDAKVHEAWTKGSDDQVEADGRAVTRAFVRANAEQDRRIAKVIATNTAINTGADHDKAKAVADIDARAADMRVRHDAKAARGHADAVQAAAIPGAVAVGNDAACTEAGGLSFDAALLMATDAEHDAATLRQLQAEIEAKREAWPK